MNEGHSGEERALPESGEENLGAGTENDREPAIGNSPRGSWYEEPEQHSSVRISRYAILGLLAALAIGTYPIIRVFLIPIVLAATFTTLFYPLHRKFLKIFRQNSVMSSLASCLVLFLCLVIPAYLVTHLVVLQMINLYQTIEPAIKDIVTRGEQSDFIRWIRNLGILRWLGRADIDVTNLLQNAMSTFLSLGSKIVNITSAGFLGFLTNLAIVFFTMFYFFMDGEKLVKRIKFLSPIRDDYEDMIFSRFLMISRATVMGTFVIGLIQGGMGGLALLVFGIDSWLLWGFIMILLAIIPLLGTWLVLIPAGVIQMITGHLWKGLGIIAASLVVSNIDSLIRPRLVGKGAKLHDLIIFFSTLGGIAAFGIMGFIVGPAIAALFVAVLDIYSTEFESQLTEANKR